MLLLFYFDPTFLFPVVVLLQFVLFQKQVISTSTGMFQKYRGLFGVYHSFFTEPFISSSSQESAHNFYKEEKKKSLNC